MSEAREAVTSPLSLDTQNLRQIQTYADAACWFKPAVVTPEGPVQSAGSAFSTMSQQEVGW